jgi:hypothetical protein
MCDKCDKGLCVTPCFRIYHTQVVFWKGSCSFHVYFIATETFDRPEMAIFWDVAPCSLVDTDQCLRCQGDDGDSKLPEDSHLHTCHCENLKSHHSTDWFTQEWKTKNACIHVLCWEHFYGRKLSICLSVSQWLMAPLLVYEDTWMGRCLGGFSNWVVW